MSAHKTELVVLESLSGERRGYVVIGIPEEQFLELNTKFPDERFTGQNRKINEAVRDGITEEEKKRIADYLRIQHTPFAFQFRYDCRFIDEANDYPSFQSDGKKFWIFG